MISQKEKFIREIERRIISGNLQCGDKLPPERELVEELEMSRTVVHTGLAELDALGFVKTRPRKGYIVTDYRTEGTIAVLESIMHYNGGKLAPELLNGLMQCRQLFETETASLAALMRTDDDIIKLNNILLLERAAETLTKRAELDFTFHHTVAIASGNSFYPLILKSFEPLQKEFIKKFYSIIEDPEQIYLQHKNLINAFEKGDAEKGKAIMINLLNNGEQVLKRRK